MVDGKKDDDDVVLAVRLHVERGGRLRRPNAAAEMAVKRKALHPVAVEAAAGL